MCDYTEVSGPVPDRVSFVIYTHSFTSSPVLVGLRCTCPRERKRKGKREGSGFWTKRERLSPQDSPYLEEPSSASVSYVHLRDMTVSGGPRRVRTRRERGAVS